MRKRPLPAVPREGQNRTAFDSAVKEDLEVLMGQRDNALLPLADTATTAEIVAKINAIIAQLQ